MNSKRLCRYLSKRLYKYRGRPWETCIFFPIFLIVRLVCPNGLLQNNEKKITDRMGRVIFKRFLLGYLQKPCDRLFEMSKWWKSLENTLHVTHFVAIMQRRMFFPTSTFHLFFPITTTFSLLYSSEEHGMSNKEFHDRCDNRGPTITIFILNNRVRNVIVFGVLFNSWNSNENGSKYGWNNGCSLFVVREDGCSECLMCTNESEQGCYYDYPTCGPHFGGLPANLGENFCGKIKVGVYFKNRKEITGSDKCFSANIQNVVVLKLNR